jgi:Tol biopolymer transport system component
MRSWLAIGVLIGSLAAAVGSLADTRAQSPAALIFASDRAPDRNPEVYSLDLARGARLDLSRNDLSDTVVAVQGAQVAFESDRRGLALYLARVGSASAARRLAVLPAGTRTASGGFSPSGEQLAVALLLFNKGKSTNVIDVLGRSGRRLARLASAALVPSTSLWSADGQEIVYAVGPPGTQRHTVRVVDARGRLRFARGGDNALWADAAPRLAIVAGTFGNPNTTDGSTVVVDEQGREIRRFAGRAVALSPDGTMLVLARAHGRAWLASVDTGELRRLPTGEVAAFSPDGRHLELPALKGTGALVENVQSARVEGHLAAFGTWLADSRRLVLLSDRGVATVATSAGRVLHRFTLVTPGESTTTFAVAPDANALVFTLQSHLPHQLYEQPASGAVQQLTRGSADHLEPAPSPDGQLIADAEFVAPCGACPPRIAVLPADGSAPARQLPNQVAGNSHPSWSPDGARIAYGENAASDTLGVFVMQSDGSQPVALAGGEGAQQPSWAPDGTAIAASHAGVVVMAPDGSGAMQLTGPVPAGADARQGYSPTWSPDSSQLAFAGADGIYVIGRDGSNQHRILAMRRVDALAWSPDGAQIAFAAACQGRTVDCTNHLTHDIWTVAPDGSNLRRVTDDVADDTTPAWLPAR